MRHRQGVVLIYSLWVLTFLTVIAVSVASGVRQKILLIKKVDEHQRAVALVQAGARHVCAVIRQVFASTNGQYDVNVKQQLHRNTQWLAKIKLGNDAVSILADPLDTSRFGVVDEESKININTASATVIQSIIEEVLGLSQDETRKLTAAILDWRQRGSSEIAGFFSDEYYRNLKFPYAKKDAPYESLQELNLVEKMTPDRFERLSPYLTVWGNGQVNINTASRKVLKAIGMSEGLIDKIMEARQGKDAIDATGDDYVFIRPFDIGIELRMLVALDVMASKEIDLLNAQGLLTTNSYYFSWVTVGYLANGFKIPSTKIVYGFKEGRFLSWCEK